MNKQQIESLLNDDPEGATHFDGKTYFRFEMYEHGQAYLVLKNGIWSRGLPAYPVFGCHSLDDLRTQLELMDRVERLEKDLAFYRCCALSGEIPDDSKRPSLIGDENE